VRQSPAGEAGPVEVHIGAIELEVVPPPGTAAALPQPASAPVASVGGPAGFDDYAALRGLPS
jgi:hypothetical protein